MFQRILIPLDGSEIAEQVLSYVRRFAVPAETQLVLVRVLETMRYPLSRFGPAPMEPVAVLHQESKRYLGEMSEQLQSQGYQATTVVAEGDAATQILTTAQDSGADLIAMATHGRSGAKRWMLGSVAERVLQAATLPILLVRGQGSDPNGKIQHILAPLDGSALAEQALPYAKKLAQVTGATLLLVEVLSTADIELEVSRWPPDAETDPAYGRRIDLAEGYLKKLTHRLQAQGIPCAYKIIYGDPRVALCTATKRSRADLVVMSTHGHSGLSRWVFGSVATQVIRDASCPVLVVRNLPVG